MRTTAAAIVACFVACAAAEDVPSGAETNPAIARLGSRDILLSEKEELNGTIFSSLLEEFAKSRNVEPSTADIEAFTAKSRLLQEQRHQESVAKHAELQAQLRAGDIPEADRKALEEQLAMYDLFLKTDQEMAAYEETHPEESRRSDDEMARTMIATWKINKALFEQYGGRVIFQQFGPEPLDAYRKFLEEQSTAGAFTILDPDVAASFWNYYTNDAMHTFYPGDDGARFINTPWWLMEETDVP